MRFNKTTLPSGLRLVTIPMPDNPSVTVLIMVEAGSRYESKQENGISHFLEHMVFKGTPRRPGVTEISRALDGIGAQYNAFTSQEFTGYYAKAGADRLDLILDVISDMYLHPLLDQKEMEKEKGVIVEEIRMYRDLPQHHVHDVLNELIYGDQPVGWEIAGTEETVRSFTRESLVAYRTEHYVAGATTVVVAGSFDEAAVAAKVGLAFSGISVAPKKGRPAVVEVQSAAQSRADRKETDQTHIALGFRTFSVLDPRLPAMHVLDAILGGGMSSRLFAKLRDELGICYYVRASHNPSTDHGSLTISAGVDNARVEEAVKVILAECARLKAEPVPEDELRKAQENIAGNTLLSLETSEARSEFAGSQEALKGRIDMPEDIIARVRAVTAADVQALARELFIDRNLNVALVGRTAPEALAALAKFPA